MSAAPRIDPRLRVLYLLAVAIGVFFIKPLWGVAIAAIVQCAVWLAVGLPPRKLARPVAAVAASARAVAPGKHEKIAA